MIIFASIIIGLPSALGQLFQLVRTDQFSLLQVIFLTGFGFYAWKPPRDPPLIRILTFVLVQQYSYAVSYTHLRAHEPLR